MVHHNAPSRRPPARRLAVVLLAAIVALGTWLIQGSPGTARADVAPAVPRAVCGPGSLPETSTQGRVPEKDYITGRVAKGYLCNTKQVGKYGQSGGFKTIRYVDSQKRVCAFYDSTLLIPRDFLSNLFNGDGLGTIVLDMTDPAHPRKTANLVSPAMLSPHESLLVNHKRGLLVAVMGTAATAPGIVDVYDVKTDCRHPKLLSTSLTGILGHESGFAPDGKTFYVAGIAGTLTAVDLTDPRRPKTLWARAGVIYHGLRVSDDGNLLYVANVGKPGPTGVTGGGVQILDVSDIQARKVKPGVPVLSTLTYDGVAIPQVAEPFTRNGHKYLLEVDEFVDLVNFSGLIDLNNAPAGTARIINVDDPRRPRVVGDIRLTVHQPSQRSGPQLKDPGAAFVAQGYAGHYCGMPTRVNPKIAGCSMILSGLRLFDIRDVRNPKEVAYFNKPTPKNTKLTFLPAIGAYAMSQPAWDPAHDSVWYTDTNSGFYVVKLTNGVQRLLH